MTRKPERRADLAARRAHRAILQAANELLESDGFAAVTVEAIAERAGVSKATIYRWWPNRAAVVMDGFLSTVSFEVPFPHTGHAREDIRIHMRRLAEAFSGKMGRTVAALIAEGQTDPELAEALRSRWLSVRRAEAREILELGIERGELRDDIDLEVAVDVLYGAYLLPDACRPRPARGRFCRRPSRPHLLWSSRWRSSAAWGRGG